jgi:hypothetical protein
MGAWIQFPNSVIDSERQMYGNQRNLLDNTRAESMPQEHG